jgi:hypothetical protein
MYFAKAGSEAQTLGAEQDERRLSDASRLLLTESPVEKSR